MKFSEYMVLAQRTSKSKNKDEQLCNGILGLIGEVGEVADIIKKHLFQGAPLNKEHLAEELGDVLWYVAEAAVGHGEEKQLAQIIDMQRAFQPCALGNVSLPFFVARAESRIFEIVYHTHFMAKEAFLPSDVYIVESLYGVVDCIKALCKCTGYDIERIEEMNIEKLKKRYPQGFSAERSNNREE